MSITVGDVVGDWGRDRQIADFVTRETADVMEGVELVSSALAKLYPGQNLDAFSDGMGAATNATAVAALFGDAAKLTAQSRECFAVGSEHGIVSSQFGRAAVDLSVEGAWAGLHAAKAAKFASSVQVMDVPDVAAQKVADWCNLYASSVGLYDNVMAVLDGKKAGVTDTEVKIYECQWWQNGFELGLNLTSLIMAVIGVASFAVCEYTIFALSMTYLVCAIASHIFESDVKQLAVRSFLLA